MIYAIFFLVALLYDFSLFHNEGNLPWLSLFIVQSVFLTSIFFALKREVRKVTMQILILGFITLILSSWFAIYTNQFFHDTFLLLLFLGNISLMALVFDKKHKLFRDISSDIQFFLYVAWTFFREVWIIWKYYASMSEKNHLFRLVLPRFFKAFWVLLLLLFIILPLLLSADQVFAEILRKFLDSFFSFSDIQWLLGRIFTIFWILYFLLTLYESLRISHYIDTRIHIPSVKIDRVYNYVVLGGLNLLYIFFIIIQIKYALFVDEHTFHTLGISYGEYIHSGFYQLIIISLINYGIYVYFHKKTHSQDDIFIKINLYGLIISTLLITYSAFSRILLYITVYHLTELRIFVIYIIVLIFFLFLLTLLHLYRERTIYATIFYQTCIASFIFLGFLNIDKCIALYNMKIWGDFLDKAYIMSLSNDAIEIKEKISLSEDANSPEMVPTLDGLETSLSDQENHNLYWELDRVPVRSQKPWLWYYNYYQDKAYTLSLKNK